MDQKIRIQKAVDWVEDNLKDEVSLDYISKYIGYSKFHTSRTFKQFTKSTLRNYLSLRRLSNSAKQLRDTNNRIVDIAVEYGYNSQEAFTKSFFKAFGITPHKYRKTLKPIPIATRKDILFPDNLIKGELITMVNKKEIKIKKEIFPKHKLIYLKMKGVKSYLQFWEKLSENTDLDADRIHGLLSSIPGNFKEGFGAITQDGYIFAKDAPIDYKINEKLPFEEKVIDEQEYLVFESPYFKEREFDVAVNNVRKVALEEYDYKANGYLTDKSFVEAYEHSSVDVCEYFIRIPLK